MTQAHERTATLSHLVGKQIKLQLFLKEMSGRDLAGMLGVSPSWVSYRLSGKQEIGLDDLARIAKALELELGQILTPEIVEQAAVPPVPPRREGINRHFRSPDDRPDDRNRTEDSRRPRVIFDGPAGQGRTDSRRPVSAVPASTRRPRDGRPRNRTARAA